jgi:hypothetical protein
MHILALRLAETAAELVGTRDSISADFMDAELVGKGYFVKAKVYDGGNCATVFFVANMGGCVNLEEVSINDSSFSYFIGLLFEAWMRAMPEYDDELAEVA